MGTDWMGKIGIQLILEDPFWGRLYRQLPRKKENRIREVSLVFEKEQGFSIAFHPAVSEKNLDPVFLSKVKHELLHFLLGHPMQRDQAEHKACFDLAADLCADQFVPPYPGSLSVQEFSDFALLPFRSAWTYYQQFLDKVKGGLPQQIAFLEQCLSDRQLQHEKHLLWNQAGAAVFDFDKLFERQVPNPEIPWPEKLWPVFQEGQKVSDAHAVSWQDQLHWLMRTSMHTQLVYKKNRRSRRYGVPPGIKIKRKHRLLIAVDTSGSVRLEELQLFFQEIHRLYRQGVEIEVVECDSQIQRRYTYSGKLPDMLIGRGDTSYQAPIELLNHEKEFGGLLYFTDGDGPPPVVYPQRPVLWVMSRRARGDMEKFERFPGKKVLM